jgi:hypothetical protein
MISGNGPVSAVTYLSDLKLFSVVFALPSSAEPSPPENCGSLSQSYLEAMWSLLKTPRPGKFSGEQRRLALYAAMFLPFRKTVYKDTKGKSVRTPLFILSSFLGLNKSEFSCLPESTLRPFSDSCCQPHF